ncbi:MAG: N-acetylmuramoyl-L-alanine amidase [Hyphomicrobiales bacterium]|nr:N-acetylmuramoyl-L-alanine amidase [Hyphomicrobiales bacterium]
MTPFPSDSPLVSLTRLSPNHNERRGKSADAILLHYTGMPTAQAAVDLLCDPKTEVSAHYVVSEDGAVIQLVPEAMRAWHAGKSFWRGETDMNSATIGIEIANAGHDGGLPPFPDAQIRSVIALCKDIIERHAIAPQRILAHSDIAPARKIDPGEAFPWEQLAAAGVGIVPPVVDLALEPNLRRGDIGASVRALQMALRDFGFDAPITGQYDAETETIVAAFQRRYRRTAVDGVADRETRARLFAIQQAHNACV